MVGAGNGIDGIRYAHAWVEIGDVVIDPSINLEEPRVIRKESYYKVGKIKKQDTKRYSHRQMCDMLTKYKMFDAWEIKRTKEELVLLKSK